MGRCRSSGCSRGRRGRCPFGRRAGRGLLSTSSIRGASSISSLQGMARSSLISSNVLVMFDILSVCSRSSLRRSLVAGGTSGCSTANSSIWACMSVSGVRNSCAALPENWRCVAKPASRRLIMPLNDSLNLLNSGSTSSLIFESEDSLVARVRSARRKPVGV